MPPYLSLQARRLVVAILMLMASSPVSLAKRPSDLTLAITLQEAVILKTLMEQIDLGSDEIGSFLAIQTPLEQLIAQQGEGVSAQQKLGLKLTGESLRDIRIFMERISIKGGGAKQVNGIMKKVEKLLPKGSPFRAQAPAAPLKVLFSLTLQEALFLLQHLQRIRVTSPELAAFLVLYESLEKALASAKEGSELSIKLPEQGPQNLLIFMQRFELVGSQARLVQGMIARLEALL